MIVISDRDVKLISRDFHLVFYLYDTIIMFLLVIKVDTCCNILQNIFSEIRLQINCYYDQRTAKIISLIWVSITTINIYLASIIIKFDPIAVDLTAATRIDKNLSIIQHKREKAIVLSKFIFRYVVQVVPHIVLL